MNMQEQHKDKLSHASATILRSGPTNVAQPALLSGRISTEGLGQPPSYMVTQTLIDSTLYRRLRNPPDVLYLWLLKSDHTSNRSAASAEPILEQHCVLVVSTNLVSLVLMARLFCP